MATSDRSTRLCPICRQPVDPASAEYPFCSQRCRTIDLGNWASGVYRIPADLPPGDHT